MSKIENSSHHISLRAIRTQADPRPFLECPNKPHLKKKTDFKKNGESALRIVRMDVKNGGENVSKNGYESCCEVEESGSAVKTKSTVKEGGVKKNEVKK